MKRGFTLIEVLIITTIIALLVLALTMSMTRQREKADDARVKGDLERIKIAFEDYYSDNNCYPPLSSFDGPEDCGSGNLAPYLGSLPCDRKTKRPYYLTYAPDQCGGYILYGQLQNTSDPDSLSSPVSYGGESYNYGVSSGNVSVGDTVGGSSPPPGGGGNTYYYCSGIDNCSSYNPALFNCAPSWADDPNCGGTQYNKCGSAGTCTPI